MYYLHREGFENCTLTFDFFATLAGSATLGGEEISARLTVLNDQGKVLMTKTDQQGETERSKQSSWSVNASKPAVYTIKIDNLATQETSAILMVNFNGCKKFQKLVKKTDMEEINGRAEKAIGTLFHNIVELEHSDARLTHRKESRLE